METTRILRRLGDGESAAAEELLPRVRDELARIAELRTFGGLSTEEVAEVLDGAERTVRRAWRAARAFLQRELGGEPEAAE